MLVAGLMQQCSYSQNSSTEKNKTTTMDSNEKKSNVYSRTDTAKVQMNEEEWKRFSERCVFNCTIERNRKTLEQQV
jgi:hypothetical protein